jgi:hypothetical protein
MQRSLPAHPVHGQQSVVPDLVRELRRPNVVDAREQEHPRVGEPGALRALQGSIGRVSIINSQRK